MALSLKTAVSTDDKQMTDRFLLSLNNTFFWSDINLLTQKYIKINGEMIVFKTLDHKSSTLKSYSQTKANIFLCAYIYVQNNLNMYLRDQVFLMPGRHFYFLTNQTLIQVLLKNRTSFYNKKCLIALFSRDTKHNIKK